MLTIRWLLRRWKTAYEVGCLVASGGGVMSAASKGAKSRGGLTIAFLPSMDRATANSYVDIAFPTGLGRARNILTARGCDALIMIGGGCGTLNELMIAYADGRPVVILQGSGGWSDRLAPVLYNGHFLDERRTVPIEFGRTPPKEWIWPLRRLDPRAGRGNTSQRVERCPTR